MTNIVGLEPTNNKSFEDFVNDLPAFENKLSDFLTELSARGIKTEELEMDHICLRTSNPEQTRALQSQLNQLCEWVNEEIINFRPILIYKLKNPITIAGKEIYCIELPYPSPDPVKQYTDGWEHVEFVVPSEAQDIDSFKTDFAERFKNYQSVASMDSQLPIAASDQKPNPTLALRDSKSSIAVKFHPASIEDIVKYKQPL